MNAEATAGELDALTIELGKLGLLHISASGFVALDYDRLAAFIMADRQRVDLEARISEADVLWHSQRVKAAGVSTYALERRGMFKAQLAAWDRKNLTNKERT